MTCRRLGSASAPKTCPSGSDTRERGCLQVERRAPCRRRLDHDEPRPVRVVVERELDLALVVPLKREATLWLDLGDRGVAFLAVCPAEARTAARAQVQVDLVGEPVLEPLGLGEGLPDVADGGRHDMLSAYHVQPPGCAIVTNRHFSRYRR